MTGHFGFNLPRREVVSCAALTPSGLGGEKSRPGKKCFVCIGQNLFRPKKVLSSADKMTSPQKALRLLQNNIFSSGKILFWPDKISFVQKKSCFGRQDFVFGKNVFFLPDKVSFA